MVAQSILSFDYKENGVKGTYSDVQRLTQADQFYGH